MLIVIVSGCSFALSLFAQFGLGMIPCFLCQVQRWCHLALFCFALFRKKAFCIIFLAASLFVSSYHTLVQLGFVEDRCKRSRITDLASYRETLAASPSCKEAWKIGGMPASALNAFLTGILLFTLFKRKQP